MKSIQIENLRSLVNTKKIRIATVNVLVGRNSSGKSSFLRFFPLFKQSAMASSSSPLLWYGDGDAVDYGDFENALSRMATDECIHLHLDFSLTNSELLDMQQDMLGFRMNEKGDQDQNEVHVKFSIRETLEGLERYEFGIKIKETHIIYKFYMGELKEILLNNLPIRKVPNIKINSFSGIVPDILIYKDLIDPKTDLYTDLILKESKFDEPDSERMKFFSERYLFSSTDIFSEEFVLFDHLAQNSRMLGVRNDTAISIAKNVKKAISQDAELKRKLIEEAVIRITPQLFKDIGEKLNTFAKGIRYLGPVRATASRFYRHQNLSVQEIDYQGRNVASFLSQLNIASKKSFESWMRLNMGYVFFAEPNGSHIEIKIRDEFGQEFNMADMGFGYSQILPVLTQIWQSTLGEDSQKQNNFEIIAIEQPELHLHPNMQFMLGKLIGLSAKLIDKSGRDVHLILETHSEHLINGLGGVIETESIRPDIFNIIAFEKPNEGITIVKQLKFNKNGLINKWPIGFLEPSI